MRGRKPTPTQQKIANGNPGKRALPENEPKPKVRKLPCPKFLKGESRKEWNRISKLLCEEGLSTDLDRAALAVYCQAWGLFVEACEKANDLETLVKTPNGHLQQNAYISLMNRKGADVIKYAAEFGMTPSARSRVAAIKENPIDPLEAFMKAQVEAREKRAGIKKVS